MKLLYIFLFISSSLLAQNLVPNPSFEQYCECPWNDGSVYLAYGWHSFGRSPDYFNSCDTNLPPTFSVPYNFIGYQYASFGNAYIGIGTSPANNQLREFIGARLIQPLVIGQTYYVNFKICLAELCDLGCDKLGILFSNINYAVDSIVDSTYCFSNFFPPGNNDNSLGMANSIPQSPHIFSSAVITDTSIWTLVSGSFIADSAYKYIIIGNFFDKDSVNFIVTNSSAPNSICAYYFIDDIYVATDSLSNNQEYEFDTLIKIFPNPVIKGEAINIQLPVKFLNAHLKIYSIVGNLILWQNLKAGNNILPLNILTQGLYLISINIGEHTIYKRLIIH